MNTRQPLVRSFEDEVEAYGQMLRSSLMVYTVQECRVETIRGIETGIIVYDTYCDDGVLRTFVQETIELMSEAQQADEEARLTAAGPGTIESMGIDHEAHPAPMLPFDEGLDESHRHPTDAHPNTD